MKSGSSNVNKMKVTVCFEDVRVVVPCRGGDLLVRDLMDEAILKYRKAAQRLSNWKISIRRLMLGADGGILDEEDRVADVIEDKDQIIADFEAYQLDADVSEVAGSAAADTEDNAKSASTASLAVDKKPVVVGVRSLPDVSETVPLKTDVGTDFNSNWMMNTTPKNCDMPNSAESVVSTNWTSPVNNALSPPSALTSHHQTQHHLQQQQQQHRQAPVMKKILKKPKDDIKKVDVSHDDSLECRSDSAVSSPDVFPSFVRDSSRKSLSNQLVMAKWLDAQERTVDAYENEQLKVVHRGRPRSAHVPSYAKDGLLQGTEDNKLILTSPQPASVCGTGFIHLRNRNVDNVESVTSGWRSSFYGTASASSVPSIPIPQYLSLNTRKKRPAPEPPSPQKMGDSMASLRSLLSPQKMDDSTTSFCSTPVTPPYFSSSCDITKGRTKQESTKQESSLPAILVTSTSVENKENEMHGRIHESSLLTSANSSNVIKSSSETKFSSDQKTVINKLTPSKKGVLAPTNTRLIGRKIAIQLKKGANGLGFSITTRDNIAGNDCPIYIKNILPVGAAVEDGRLIAGDRLLEVNGLEMTGKTQNEAVQVLRGIPVNSTVDILVSRQVLAEDELDENSEVKDLDVNTAVTEIGLDKLPTLQDVVSIRKELVNPLPLTEPDVIERKVVSLSSEEEHDRNLLTFDIPFSSNPMLGISFNMALQGGRDLGIFVQKARLKNGPLLVNDQLVEVNGISLRGLTNSKAIQIVGDALKHQVPGSNMHLAVLRPKATESKFFASIKFDQGTIGGQSDKATSLIHQTNDAECIQKNLGSAADSSSDKNRTAKENDIQHSLDFKSSQKSSNDFREMLEIDVQSAEDDTGDDTCGSKLPKELTDHHAIAEHVNKDFTADESFDDITLTPGFAREGFGRQSISEKRKGHADPSNLDIYQKIKSNKMTFDSGSWDPRKSTLHKSTGFNFAGSRREDLLPKFSAKKCKSLENLHGFGQQMELLAEQVEATPAVRGNNQSFLVAVDRSYESPRHNPTAELGPDHESLRTRDSILTLSKAPLIPGLMKSDKKTDMDKIRSIIKKGTDMLRFSKRRKSAADETKDVPEARRQLNVGVVSWGSKKMESDAVTPQLKSDARSGMAANAADSEQWPGDCCPSLPTEHDSELEVTHFGADCVTRVVKDGSEWMRMNAAAEKNSPGEQALKAHPEGKMNKLQQLRAQYQRFHRERRGQYPLDDIQDQYEKQLQDQERSQATSQHSLSTWYSSRQPSEEKARRTQTRSRPQPISVQPEISAQLEYPENNSESSFFVPSSHYPYYPSGFQNYQAAYVHNPYFYTIRDEGQDLSSISSSEPETHYNAQLYINNSHDSRTVAPTGLPQNGLSYSHDRQKSSPLPTSPAVPCSGAGDRRHSYSERLPMASACHLETSYDQPSTARLPDCGGIVSQSSRV